MIVQLVLSIDVADSAYPARTPARIRPAVVAIIRAARRTRNVASASVEAVSYGTPDGRVTLDNPPIPE